jgi:S1-C subfamily serine protease
MPRFAVEPTSPEPKIGDLAPPRYSEGARVVFFDADGTPQLSGLKMGDVITRFDSRPVNNPNDFAIAAFLTHPAEVHSLTVRRNGGKEISISIVMGGDALPQRPAPPEPQPLAPRGMTVAAPAL